MLMIDELLNELKAKGVAVDVKENSVTKTPVKRPRSKVRPVGKKREEEDF